MLLCDRNSRVRDPPPNRFYLNGTPSVLNSQGRAPALALSKLGGREMNPVAATMLRDALADVDRLAEERARLDSRKTRLDDERAEVERQLAQVEQEELFAQRYAEKVRQQAERLFADAGETQLMEVDLVSAANHGERLKLIAKARGNRLEVKEAADILRRAGLAKSKPQNLRSLLNRYLKPGNGWERIRPGLYRLLDDTAT